MIREADLTPRDIYGIKRLIKEGVEHGHLLPRSEEEIREIIAQRHFYVADHTLGIIGCAALEVYSPRLAEIRSLSVMPSFRRGKLGTLLVARCVEKARRLGVQEVLAVTDQVKFYESVGFRKQLRGQYPLFLKLGD